MEQAKADAIVKKAKDKAKVTAAVKATETKKADAIVKKAEVKAEAKEGAKATKDATKEVKAADAK